MNMIFHDWYNYTRLPFVFVDCTNTHIHANGQPDTHMHADGQTDGYSCALLTCSLLFVIFALIGENISSVWCCW